jgi:hypothetical protein
METYTSQRPVVVYLTQLVTLLNGICTYLKVFKELQDLQDLPVQHLKLLDQQDLQEKLDLQEYKEYQEQQQIQEQQVLQDPMEVLLALKGLQVKPDRLVREEIQEKLGPLVK